jgi:hypothetical protein
MSGTVPPDGIAAAVLLVPFVLLSLLVLLLGVFLVLLVLLPSFGLLLLLWLEVGLVVFVLAAIADKLATSRRELTDSTQRAKASRDNCAQHNKGPAGHDIRRSDVVRCDQPSHQACQHCCDSIAA